MAEDRIKILVVEDEMIIGARIALYLSELGYEVTGLVPRAEEALLHLRDNHPDIILLDIQLRGDMDGIALAEVLQQDHHQIPVVYLTANADDATFERARATQPYAFLSKPLNKKELKRALELTAGFLPESAPPSPRRDDREESLADRLFVHYKGKKIKIMLENILYVEADRNYCRIITNSSDYLLSMPMKSLEGVLPKSLFQRIHRSYIVNLKQVEEMDEHTVVVGGTPLALSKSYRKEVARRIRSV